MRHLRKLFSLAGLLPVCLWAQTVRQPLTVRYAALGVYSKNFVDVFSGTANQAALARLQSGGLGVYGERRFMLDALNQFSAVVALPTTSSGTFAVQGDYFGGPSLNENQLGLAYGRQVAEQVDVGVKFNYHSITVSGYGTTQAINFEAGAIMHLTDKLRGGLHVYNPFSSKFNKGNNERLPAIYKTGLGYEASPQFLVSLEVVKQEDVPVNVNAGLTYLLHEAFMLRAGVSTLANNSFAGIGLRLGQARIDINAAYHQQLGFTPGLLLLYQFKKANQP